MADSDAEPPDADPNVGADWQGPEQSMFLRFCFEASPMLMLNIPVRDWIIRCLDDGSRCQLYLA